jgi:hypothetical protein
MIDTTVVVFGLLAELLLRSDASPICTSSSSLPSSVLPTTDGSILYPLI